MKLILKSAVIIFGLFFLVIGVVGLFKPQMLADALQFGVTTAEATGNLRAMIGAHYLAMGVVCFYAVIKNLPRLLVPIGLIEGSIVGARVISAFNAELTFPSMTATGMEVLAAAILIFAAYNLPETD